MLETVPNVRFLTLVKDEIITGGNPRRWESRTTDDYFKGKKVVLFALPGAFTPTCSISHLPGYEKLYDDIISQGIDEIYCLSVNDPYVMDHWGSTQGVDKVKLIPDGNGDFTRLMGMLVDAKAIGFGYRSWRYSMLVDDKVIQKQFVEIGCGLPKVGDPYDVSDAQTMLNYLKSI